jgi:alanyl-tRNA synthetase
MTGVNEIRSAFLDYFKAKNDHEVVASGPLVPRNDPTLMFTNAGMVQFKNVFTGPGDAGLCACGHSQKCVRAGGKHNDLDNVGYTARHHTFFEMLGNFSFGDYFKEEAIELAWNLITKEFGLPEGKLLVTVYAEDDEAFDLWKKIAGFATTRSSASRPRTISGDGRHRSVRPVLGDLLRSRRSHLGRPSRLPDEDGDRFIEIWNLVFMQYEQVPDERVDLPRRRSTPAWAWSASPPSAGRARQLRHRPVPALIAASENATGVEASGDRRVSHRVIADHLRSSSFLIADGVLPSNEGRGYVLRRIMRRACATPICWARASR